MVLCKWLGCAKMHHFDERKQHEQRDCEVCRRREELIAIKSSEDMVFACPVGCDMKIPRRDLDRHR